jgi:hypothetical protein
MEESDFKSLEPFLTRWGAGEALQELFFYQVNFVPIYQPPTSKFIAGMEKNRQDWITYFQSREKLVKMDFSQLQEITLNFGKGFNADLPPDLVKFFGECIKNELFAEASLDLENTTWEEYQTVFGEQFERTKEKVFITSKLKILEAKKEVEAILKGKSKDTIFTKKQIMLCTYGIFHQRGYRLKFDNYERTEPETPDGVFDHIDVYNNIRAHLSKD